VATVRLDADGDRIPDRKGDTVTVAGRSVVGTGTFVPSNRIAVQDPTAGIHVLLPDSVDVGRGDSVRVPGVVEHETGLTRLRALRATLVSEAGRVPTPMPLTVPTSRSEAYEGTFVHLRAQVVRVGGNDGGKYLILSDVSDGGPGRSMRPPLLKSESWSALRPPFGALPSGTLSPEARPAAASGSSR
jgi:hypothetical protein